MHARSSNGAPSSARLLRPLHATPLTRTGRMLTRSLLSLPALLFAASMAHAEIPCMPKESAVSELMGPRYSELPLFEATLPSPSQSAESDGTQVLVTVFAN